MPAWVWVVAVCKAPCALAEIILFFIRIVLVLYGWFSAPPFIPLKRRSRTLRRMAVQIFEISLVLHEKIDGGLLWCSSRARVL